jgi:Fe-S-cluster containining protein
MEKKGIAIRRMCPLNFNSLCLLYDYRPLICRLHGISYELRRPGHNIMPGAGCETFSEQCHEKGYIKFDRTPFYTAMAELENELRLKINIRQKLKLTVSQMLIY